MAGGGLEDAGFQTLTQEPTLRRAARLHVGAITGGRLKPVMEGRWKRPWAGGRAANRP